MWFCTGFAEFSAPNLHLGNNGARIYGRHDQKECEEDVHSRSVPFRFVSYNIKIQWCRAAFRAEQFSRTTCGPFLPLSCSPHPHLRIISCSRRGRTMRVRPPFLFQFTFHRRALWTRTAARSPRRAAEAEARPLTASCAHHRALASTTSQATWVPGATGLPPTSPLRIGGVVMGEVFLKAAWWAPSFLPAPPLAPW